MRRILFIFLLAASLSLLPNVTEGQNVAQGVKVIVIDAGHGGPRFPGARYAGYNEKDINLQVALKLGSLIEKSMPQVKVVYTRKVEKQFSSVLAEDLQARADIAHRNNGDLFISIHANAHRDIRTQGVETLIMGESSMETRVNENILYAHNKDELLDMSDQKTAAIVRAYIQNLQFTYGEYSEMMARLIQEEYVKLGFTNRGVKRQPLKVLYATDMPSVLTEIGFMSNSQDLKYITSSKGQWAIANAIFRAVEQYVTNVRKLALVESPKPAAPTVASTPSGSQAKSPVQSTATASSSRGKSKATKRSYTVQILASAKPVEAGNAEFKSYRNKVREIRGGGALKYKYCVGDYADKAAAQEAAKRIRTEFPSAFIVTLDDGAIASK